MIRDAFHMSPDGFRAMKARADDRGIGLGVQPDLKRGDPAPLFGLPVFEDQRIPAWILAIVWHRHGQPVAILPGGRILSPIDRDRVRLDGIDWIREAGPEAALNSVGVPCFASLAAIVAGEALFRPADRDAAPWPLARLKASAIDLVLDFRPRRTGR